ncbi:MAG TPA: TonB-dependent receptor [Vicinamibacterales bacterium]|nr:TonB-dependent receptor [Vicinamibacterales bacterium]
MNRVLTGVVLTVILLSGSLAFAQSAPVGTIRGYVKDSQGAVLPGVTITATSPSVPTPSVAVSDGQGFFRLVDLVPADYRIEAELQGFAKYVRDGVAVRAGLNISLDIAMTIGNMSESVQVVAETPLLETQKATTSVNISGELQRQLPLSSRSQFADFLEVTPGVAARAGDATGGGQIYMMRGGELENHVIQLDGADMGSFRQNRADRLLTLDTDAIDDVQVTTAAVDASVPLGSGAVINVATKSGTDHFKGAIGAIYTPESWNGDNAGGGDVRFNKIFQPDLSLGGPILPGKVWFYGSYRRTQQSSGIGRTPEQIALLEALRPGFEAFDNAVNSNDYYLKGTSRLSSRHRLSAFYETDQHAEQGDREWYAQPIAVTQAGGMGTSVRLESIWGNSVTSRLVGSYNNKSTNSNFDVYNGYIHDGPSESVNAGTFLSKGVIKGTGEIALLNNDSSYGISPASKATFQADLTYYHAGLAGSHELQTGLFVQALRSSDETRYPNDGYALEELVLNDPANPAAGLTPFHKEVYDAADVKEDATAANDYGFYVQDNWHPASRLTLNLGVRFDQIKATERVFGVRLEDAMHVGPRLGATWVLTSDQANVVKASFSRVHEMPMPRNLGSVGSASAGVTDYYDNDLDGTFETVLFTPGTTTARSDRVPDPQHHQPFIDEWTVGYQRQLPGTATVSIDFAHREYKDIPALVETNGIYDGNVFKGYQDEAFNQIYSITNNQWNSLVYEGIELTFSKRSKWVQLLGGYTRAFDHIAGTWQPNDPASFIQPDAFPNDRGIGSIRGNKNNSLSGDSDTRSPSWQPNNFRVGGTFLTPWGVTAAVSYAYQSGEYSGSVVTNLDSPDPQFGPSKVKLSNGRTVSNPLATTIRFAYPTRGEGQLSLPALQDLNVRLGYDLNITGNRQVRLALDVFNVMNRGSFEQWLDGANQLYSPNYGLGRARQFPRVFQASVRFSF